MMTIFALFGAFLAGIGILIIFSFHQGIKEIRAERERNELKAKMLKEDKDLKLNEKEC